CSGKPRQRSAVATSTDQGKGRAWGVEIWGACRRGCVCDARVSGIVYGIIDEEHPGRTAGDRTWRCGTQEHLNRWCNRDVMILHEKYLPSLSAVCKRGERYVVQGSIRHEYQSATGCDLCLYRPKYERVETLARRQPIGSRHRAETSQGRVQGSCLGV